MLVALILVLSTAIIPALLELVENKQTLFKEG